MVSCFGYGRSGVTRKSTFFSTALMRYNPSMPLIEHGDLDFLPCECPPTGCYHGVPVGPISDLTAGRSARSDLKCPRCQVDVVVIRPHTNGKSPGVVPLDMVEIQSLAHGSIRRFVFEKKGVTDGV